MERRDSSPHLVAPCPEEVGGRVSEAVWVGSLSSWDSTSDCGKCVAHQAAARSWVQRVLHSHARSCSAKSEAESGRLCGSFSKQERTRASTSAGMGSSVTRAGGSGTV